MTSEEPRPIDSFRPNPGPSEWGSGGSGGQAAAGIKMLSLKRGWGWMRSGKQGHSLLARPLGKPLRRKRARVYSSPTSRPQWADILGASLLTPMNIKEIAERQSASAIEGAGAAP